MNCVPHLLVDLKKRPTIMSSSKSNLKAGEATNVTDDPVARQRAQEKLRNYILCKHNSARAQEKLEKYLLHKHNQREHTKNWKTMYFTNPSGETPSLMPHHDFC